MRFFLWIPKSDIYSPSYCMHTHACTHTQKKGRLGHSRTFSESSPSHSSCTALLCAAEGRCPVEDEPSGQSEVLSTPNQVFTKNISLFSRLAFYSFCSLSQICSVPVSELCLQFFSTYGLVSTLIGQYLERHIPVHIRSIRWKCTSIEFHPDFS